MEQTLPNNPFSPATLPHDKPLHLPHDVDFSDAEDNPAINVQHLRRPLNFKDALLNGSFTSQVPSSQHSFKQSVDLIRARMVSVEYIDGNPLYPKFSVAPDFLDHLSGP